MSTIKQIAANRANAQKSTGPKTPAGRAAVHLNALRHGLAAEAVVLPDENEKEFDETRAAFEAEHAPVGPTENLLVQQIIVAAWRLRRIRLMTTGYIEFRLAHTAEAIEEDFEDPNQGSRLGYVAWQDEGTLELLARYETRVERSFYRALHELRLCQTARAARDTKAPDAPSPSPEPIANTSAEQSQSDANSNVFRALPRAEPPQHRHQTDVARRPTDHSSEEVES